MDRSNLFHVKTKPDAAAAAGSTRLSAVRLVQSRPEALNMTFQLATEH